MFEKVNKYHPDKVADRIAGAIVDAAYALVENPKVAVEVLIGHGKCFIIIETSVSIATQQILDIVKRIAPNIESENVEIKQVPQDEHLNKNQRSELRCGDNGIFKGTPITDEQRKLAAVSDFLESKFGCDGKYILNGEHLIICQSNASKQEIAITYPDATINPLGYWTGGTDVDSGATNRKLGSDMGDGITGGGINGKDLSKADVTLNIYCFLKAQELGKPYQVSCAIGDNYIDGKPYAEIVEIARNYIKSLGGFEKFSEQGFVRCM